MTLTLDPAASSATWRISDGAGTITISDDGADVLVDEVAAGATNLAFSLMADTGDIKVNTIGAGSSAVSLTSTADSIVDNDASLGITADAL